MTLESEFSIKAIEKLEIEDLSEKIKFLKHLKDNNLGFALIALNDSEDDKPLYFDPSQIDDEVKYIYHIPFSGFMSVKHDNVACQASIAIEDLVRVIRVFNVGPIKEINPKVAQKEIELRK